MLDLKDIKERLGRLAPANGTLRQSTDGEQWMAAVDFSLTVDQFDDYCQSRRDLAALLAEVERLRDDVTRWKFATEHGPLEEIAPGVVIGRPVLRWDGKIARAVAPGSLLHLKIDDPTKGWYEADENGNWVPMRGEAD